MSDKIEITVKVNGEEVPLSNLSEETICNIKAAEIVIPTFRTCLAYGYRDEPRLLINYKGKVISISQTGHQVLDWPLEQDRDVIREYYEDVKEIDLFTILKGRI